MQESLWNKFSLFRDTVEHLGEVVHQGSLEIDQTNNASPHEPKNKRLERKYDLYSSYATSTDVS